MLILAYEDRTFDDWWSGIAQFLIYHTFDAILGHIPFRDLHACPYLRDTRRDDDLFVILSWYPREAFFEPFS